MIAIVHRLLGVDLIYTDRIPDSYCNILGVDLVPLQGDAGIIIAVYLLWI